MSTDVGLFSEEGGAGALAPRPIAEVAAELGVGAFIPYGEDKAKVGLDLLDRPRRAAGPPKLVLVSAITPTPAGEGKTTTTIGLGDALRRQGRSVCLALREPSLGPCFGVKGGGTGGGKAHLVPSAEINLHFNGDFHAITSAHNLISAVVDNHLHFDTELRLDPRRVRWPRVLDMNDRALRDIVVGLGGTADGIPRQASFDITAASEIMAILCLSTDMDDLRRRIDDILVGFDRDGRPVRGRQLGCTGAVLALLRDALRPNLVQSAEGTPAFVHGGPFANIAHGCNSILATRMALHHAEWVLTEAGFGFDLGGEKFLDIKCALGGFEVAAVVVVTTVRAMKMHGGVELSDLKLPNPEAVRTGLVNLERHLDSVAVYGLTPVVAVNRHFADTDEEVEVILQRCLERGVAAACSDHYAKGGEGALALADRLVEVAAPRPVRAVQRPDQGILQKLEAIARQVYGARGVVLTKAAQGEAREIARMGFGALPVCVAKTQSSVSDDPKLRGRPTDFDVTVRGLRLNAGAGFIVALAGEIVRMPGLPRHPAAETIDVVDGRIIGLG
jgi:formate--tetrahydrofolate ligase